jgi:hypothetical protein
MLSSLAMPYAVDAVATSTVETLPSISLLVLYRLLLHHRLMYWSEHEFCRAIGPLRLLLELVLERDDVLLLRGIGCG